jgi:hypothetical protein
MRWRPNDFHRGDAGMFDERCVCNTPFLARLNRPPRSVLRGILDLSPVLPAREQHVLEHITRKVVPKMGLSSTFG